MAVGAFGSLLAFVAVASFVLWLGSSRARPAEARLRRLRVPPRTRSTLEAPFGERVVLPIAETLTKIVMQVLPQTMVARTARHLITAGRPMTTQAFFFIVLMSSAVLSGFFFFLLLVVTAGSPPLLAVLFVLVLAAVGTAFPFFWLSRRVRNRKLAIWKTLPDAFDLVTVSIEAGLGLDAALRQVAEKLHGPIAVEITQMLREVGMGRPRREALEEMAARADVTELITFVNAVIQAEQLGTSLGRVLRAQAVTLRTRRRQRAEEMARKAPAKMVFPLVLCIMPALFIVVLGPIVVRLVNYLTG